MASLTEKMKKESSKEEEVDAKRRKLAHECISIEEDKQFKPVIDVSTTCISRPKDQNMEDIVNSDVQKLISLVEEDRNKHPLPKNFDNTLSNFHDGNCMLRFEDIGMLAAAKWNLFPLFIPKGIRDHVMYTYAYSSGSKTYGFVVFSCHEIARRFLNEFNGLQIPRTGLSYKLSWAPFVFLYDSPHKYLDGQVNEVTKNSEINEQVDGLTVFNLEEKSEINKQFLELADAFEEFYITLDENVHKEKRAPWLWPKSVWPAYLPGDDDGSTTTLYLSMVDPIITEDQLKHIFANFGECYVNSPAGKGCGYACFQERESAEDALRSLQHVFERNNIGNIYWGIKEDEEEDLYADVVLSPRPCDILGPQCRHTQQACLTLLNNLYIKSVEANNAYIKPQA